MREGPRRAMKTTHILEPALWWDRLLASDPALDRLRLAARATVSAGLAAAVLATLARWVHQPATVALLGATVAMNSSLVVNDPEPRQQARTLLLVPLSAASALLLGSVAAPHPWFGPAAFLGVVFVAVYVRRFGPRGTALGMIAFFTFFFSLVFHPVPQQVPWWVAGATVGAAISATVRFLLFPERPDWMLRHSLEAFRRAVALVLHPLELAAEAPAWTEHHDRSLRRPLARLNDTALELEALVERASPGALAPGLSAEELRERIFELELATQRVVGAVRQVVETPGLPPAARSAVRQALGWARVAVRTGDASAGARAVQELAAARDALGGAPAPATVHALERLEVTLRDLLAAAAWTWRPAPRGGLTGEVGVSRPSAEGRAEEEPPAAAAPPTAAPARQLRPSTRQAIQATLAAALAIAAGKLLSGERWHWAVIAAFVVFVRVSSAGEALVRVWQRILGTLAGVVLGVLLAHWVAGHRTLELALVFVFIFLGHYLLRLSSAWMAMWITALLAILYSLLGRYTPGLLVLRLTETLVGALAAALVAVWILPVRTGEQVRQGLGDVLRALGHYLANVVRPGTMARATPALLAEARTLDGKLRTLRDRASPLIMSRLRLAPELERAVHATSAAVSFSRHLVPAHGLATLEGDARQAVSAVASRLAQRADGLAERLEGREGREARVGSAAELVEQARDALREQQVWPGVGHGPAVALRWMARIDAALTEAEEALRPLRGTRPGTGGP